MSTLFPAQGQTPIMFSSQFHSVPTGLSKILGLFTWGKAYLQKVKCLYMH